VRHVAVYLAGELRMRRRAGLAGASTSEPDRYEELLVIPTLLTLATQRVADRLRRCGVSARPAWQFLHVHPAARGHVNVGFELDARLEAVIEAVRQVVADWAAAEGTRRTPNSD
jgi:hypothetical protein